jgi:hypothetical protein
MEALPSVLLMGAFYSAGLAGNLSDSVKKR